MPHCILEYSANVTDRPDLHAVLQAINDVLVTTGLFDPGDIKSRAVAHDTVVIGDGAADRTFVTVDVQMLGGKSDEVKAQLADSVLAVLERAYPETLARTRCSLTVQISDIHRASYRRIRTYED